MLKVLNSKICEKRTKACVKALKKVKHSKPSGKQSNPSGKHSKPSGKHSHTKHSHTSGKHKHKHKHKHKTTHGDHHNITIKIGNDKKENNPIPPPPPYTPNPPPSGFINYTQPPNTLASVNRHDILALQKEFKNGLSQLRNLWNKKDTTDDPFVSEEPAPADEQAPAGDGVPKTTKKKKVFKVRTKRPNPPEKGMSVSGLPSDTWSEISKYLVGNKPVTCADNMKCKVFDSSGKCLHCETKRRGRPKGAKNKPTSALGGETGSGTLRSHSGYDPDDTEFEDGDLGGGGAGQSRDGI